MSVALNNITTADSYSVANTLIAPGAERLTIHARNAAIYYQLGTGVGGVEWRLDEVFMPPGTFSGDRRYDAVRVRSAAAGKPAQVTIDAGAQEARGA